MRHILNVTQIIGLEKCECPTWTVLNAGLGVRVSVYFNLLRKLLDSYFYARRRFFFNFFEGLYEPYHHVGQGFLHEMVQGESNIVDANFRLKTLLNPSMLRTHRITTLRIGMSGLITITALKQGALMLRLVYVRLLPPFCSLA